MAYFLHDEGHDDPTRRFGSIKERGDQGLIPPQTELQGLRKLHVSSLRLPNPEKGTDRKPPCFPAPQAHPFRS